MSGGHYDYFSFKLNSFIEEIKEEEQTKEEIKLTELLKDLSDVLYELEWWKSGDTGIKDFKKSYNKFKKKWLREAL